MKALGMAAADHLLDIAQAAACRGDFEYFPRYSVAIEYGDLDLERPSHRAILSARILAATDALSAE